MNREDAKTRRREDRKEGQIPVIAVNRKASSKKAGIKILIYNS